MGGNVNFSMMNAEGQGQGLLGSTGSGTDNSNSWPNINHNPMFNPLGPQPQMQMPMHMQNMPFVNNSDFMIPQQQQQQQEEYALQLQQQMMMQQQMMFGFDPLMMNMMGSTGMFDGQMF